MRTRFLLPAALAICCAAARADIPTEVSGATAPAGAATTEATPVATAPDAGTARVQELQKRFADAVAVEKQGDLQRARQMFDAIIKDAPDAKGSLQQAGIISVQLNDYVHADEYFSKLHVLVPDYAGAIEALIQVNQALKRDMKVEIMIEQLSKLWEQGKTDKPYFVREHIKLESGSQIEIAQFFDYHQKPNIAWMAEYLDPQGMPKRRLAVNFDPEVTASIRAKDPKLANAEQFLVVDNVMQGDKFSRIDVYQQFLALPDYNKMRTVLLQVFANALKPIGSGAVPANAQGGAAPAGQ